MSENDISDGAIIYQLDKVDQAGAVTDLFEDRMEFLAKEWGYEYNEGGWIDLPDGRRATLTFEPIIEDKEGYDARP